MITYEKLNYRSRSFYIIEVKSHEIQMTKHSFYPKGIYIVAAGSSSPSPPECMMLNVDTQNENLDSWMYKGNVGRTGENAQLSGKGWRLEYVLSKQMRHTEVSK